MLNAFNDDTIKEIKHELDSDVGVTVLNELGEKVGLQTVLLSWFITFKRHSVQQTAKTAVIVNRVMVCRTIIP